MPYKNKEDRTKAVRRHREKQKAITDAMALEAEVRDFFKQMSLISLSWDELIEITKEFVKDEQGIWRLKDGRKIYPPEEALFWLDTIVIR